MTDSDHLDNFQLIGLLDGETPPAEADALRLHLSSCQMCRRNQDEFAQLSSGVASVINGGRIESSPDGRANLASALAAADADKLDASNSGNIMRRFGWAMAVAASLAIALLFVPAKKAGFQPVQQNGAKTSSSSLDVNGESFIALPYSDPNLPLNAARIVETQVPVSSLAAAGIVLEPGMNDGSDRTVLANVLLGIDGQPLGLHVLTAE